MPLLQRVQADVSAALKAGDRERAGALRMIVSELQKVAKEGALQGDLSEESMRGYEVEVLQRERKRRQEAAEAYRAAGRTDQADAEEHELAVLQEFMPAPLSDDELEAIIDDAIAENGATSIRDLGRVMADVMPQVAGRADGSTVTQLVREKLA